MPAFICTTCGTQYAPTDAPPKSCPICDDERQYVPPPGQGWTTLDTLAKRNMNAWRELEPNLISITTAPAFGIGQRAQLLRTPQGNILWDCISLIDRATIEMIKAMGGLNSIAISHPHYYSCMVEWSQAFGGIPIHLHEADREWIARPSERIELWSGDRRLLGDGVTLIHLPGHFPGSTALLWERPQRTALLVGDSIHVAADRRHVTVMHSVPNYIPVGPGTIRDISDRLMGLDFDDVYGFTWGPDIIGGARVAVDESLDRYLAAIS